MLVRVEVVVVVVVVAVDGAFVSEADDDDDANISRDVDDLRAAGAPHVVIDILGTVLPKVLVPSLVLELELDACNE
jgi:hypothetical protein